MTPVRGEMDNQLMNEGVWQESKCQNIFDELKEGEAVRLIEIHGNEKKFGDEKLATYRICFVQIQLSQYKFDNMDSRQCMHTQHGDEQGTDIKLNMPLNY